jgi:hypothetical protein
MGRTREEEECDLNELFDFYLYFQRDFNEVVAAEIEKKPEVCQK